MSIFVVKSNYENSELLSPSPQQQALYNTLLAAEESTLHALVAGLLCSVGVVLMEYWWDGLSPNNGYEF